jgi:hypothetical protein
MKKHLPLIAILLVTLCSCQKLIDKQKEKVAMGIITDGLWYVEQYKVDSSNISSEFLNYTFQFKEDGTVTSTNGTISASGTWSPDIPAQSIISNFPTANDPVKKMNGTWKITDSYSNYVEAYMLTATGKNKLHLRKQE